MDDFYILRKPRILDKNSSYLFRQMNNLESACSLSLDIKSYLSCSRLHLRSSGQFHCALYCEYGKTEYKQEVCKRSMSFITTVLNDGGSR